MKQSIINLQSDPAIFGMALRYEKATSFIGNHRMQTPCSVFINGVKHSNNGGLYYRLWCKMADHRDWYVERMNRFVQHWNGKNEE